jgi:hypothetical protein
MFGIDGRFYEIDLSRENAAMLRGRLRRFVAAGRRVDSHVGPARRAAFTPPDPALSEQRRLIRFWARQRGMSVPAQGPVPTAVAEAYRRVRLGWRPAPGLGLTSDNSGAGDLEPQVLQRVPDAGTAP